MCLSRLTDYFDCFYHPEALCAILVAFHVYVKDWYELYLYAFGVDLRVLSVLVMTDRLLRDDEEVTFFFVAKRSANCDKFTLHQQCT